MKSIVLCERTLIQKSEDFNNLKEEKVGEEGNEEEKKIFNGAPNNKKLESHKTNSKKYEVTFQNGDEISAEPSFKEGVCGIVEKEPQPSIALESKALSKELSDGTNTSVGITKNGTCIVESGTDFSGGENVSSESEILENLDVQNNSKVEERGHSKGQVNLSEQNDTVGEDVIQIIESERSDNSFLGTDSDSSKKSCEIDVIEEEEFKNIEGKSNVQHLEDIILDLDENKENEKEEGTGTLENCPGGDLLTKHSNECEIQVGEVQTISGLEKDSMWAENDLKKSEEAGKENSDENVINDCHDFSLSNEESVNTILGEKDEGQELESDDNIVLDADESVEEGMHIEVEEVEQTEETKTEEKEREQTDLETFSANKITSDSEMSDKGDYLKSEISICRKRQISELEDRNQSFKKKRLSKDEDVDQMQLEEDKAEESSRCESLGSLDPADSASKDQLLSEAKSITTKRTSTDIEDLKKLKSSETPEETKIKNHQTSQAMFSVLEKFRGTLKTLTRSDLEELIVQKLCEVITERSNVGELRRKAQALEQDQERWKAKAQSLTKQMREMEMVMRKYMSEVHKQIKEGDNQVVTPLKVTRSVGLQVSFYSSTNKTSKPNLPQSAPSSMTQNVNIRNGKGPPSKLPSQCSPVTQNMRNKPSPSFQKGSPSIQKSPISQQRRSIVPKPDYSSSPSNRSTVVQQSLLNNNRGPSNQVQVSRPNYKMAPGTSSQQHQHQQQPQPLPQQQQTHHQQPNGSKVIDLTEDDDRQTANIGMLVKTPGSVRVINHLSQPPAPQSNRFAYLLPTTSAPTGSPIGQSRQVLIATPTMPQPNRQIMCSMPPLLFKGGSAVQSSSQPQMLNPSNKVILPKALRHPAPLPQRPTNQSTKRSLKLLPPRPALKISKVQTGIVLSWNMSLGPEHAPIASYQLYAYQESDSPPATSLWKKVGDVKALPLPMACTLTQFMSGHKYHFAVRAVDLHSRIGPFSYPGTIVLV